MQLFLMKILYTIDSVVEQWQVCYMQDIRSEIHVNLPKKGPHLNFDIETGDACIFILKILLYC